MSPPAALAGTYKTSRVNNRLKRRAPQSTAGRKDTPVPRAWRLLSSYSKNHNDFSYLIFFQVQRKWLSAGRPEPTGSVAAVPS